MYRRSAFNLQKDCRRFEKTKINICYIYRFAKQQMDKLLYRCAGQCLTSQTCFSHRNLSICEIKMKQSNTHNRPLFACHSMAIISCSIQLISKDKITSYLWDSGTGHHKRAFCDPHSCQV